jgi:hypothetical protein
LLRASNAFRDFQGPQSSDMGTMSRVPAGYVIRAPASPRQLIGFRSAAKNEKTTAPRRGISLFRRSYGGAPRLIAVGATVLILCLSAVTVPVAHAKAAPAKPEFPRAALGGFIKDRAMARVLGETLFRDTVDVMSDLSVPPPVSAPATGTPDQSRDNSAAGQVARTVLAHQTLDKYLWLIQQAYDDALWRGGDRARIEQHFPLIWRTSIMLYEATLNASPHRVRICTPADDGESFDCRDEIERAKIVPIPSQAPLIGQRHEATSG